MRMWQPVTERVLGRPLDGPRARSPICFALALVALLSGSALAAEEPGNWRFSDDTKPVKVFVLGGSVAAYPAGSFSQWLPGVCANIEVVNRAKAKLGAFELRQRFIAQVVKNRRLDDETKKKTWLVFLGGLNSVGSPETTNSEVAKTLKLAKEQGLSTLGVTINPWGAETDRRWEGIDGIAYLEHSQRTVDFMMGRLTPLEAFGKAHLKGPGQPFGPSAGGHGQPFGPSAGGHGQPFGPSAGGHGQPFGPSAGVPADQQFLPGELPDVAVDVWSGSLRHVDAPLRDVAKLTRSAKRSDWLKKRLAAAPEAERPALLERLVALAAELPRWFMKPQFVGFDPIHPNASGHREIAQAICEKAPPSWGCSCGELPKLTWDRRGQKPKAL